MQEPIRRPMTNGPVQKKVKMYRMADSMTTYAGDEATLEWIKNKQYPETEKTDENHKESD